MLWLDPTSPPVRSAVVSGVWGREPHSVQAHPIATGDDIDAITDALTVASEMLTPLTGYRIHPAGKATETFTVAPRPRRLKPHYRPVREVVAVRRKDMVGGAIDDTNHANLWLVQGDSIVFNDTCGMDWRGFYGYSYGYAGPWNSLHRGQNEWELQQRQYIDVDYLFGSTVTYGARRAVLWLAHQFWMSTDGCDSCGDCQLPERTTTVTREGLSYTLLNPQDFLKDGRTGVPTVDLWLSTVNPRGSLNRGGVWTPDSSPPVNVTVKALRAAWA